MWPLQYDGLRVVVRLLMWELWPFIPHFGGHIVSLLLYSFGPRKHSPSKLKGRVHRHPPPHLSIGVTKNLQMDFNPTTDRVTHLNLPEMFRGYQYLYFTDEKKTRFKEVKPMYYQVTCLEKGVQVCLISVPLIISFRLSATLESSSH